MLFTDLYMQALDSHRNGTGRAEFHAAGCAYATIMHGSVSGNALKTWPSHI